MLRIELSESLRNGAGGPPAPGCDPGPEGGVELVEGAMAAGGVGPDQDGSIFGTGSGGSGVLGCCRFSCSRLSTSCLISEAVSFFRSPLGGRSTLLCQI